MSNNSPPSDLEFIYHALVNVQRLLEELIKKEQKKGKGS